MEETTHVQLSNRIILSIALGALLLAGCAKATQVEINNEVIQPTSTSTLISTHTATPTDPPKPTATETPRPTSTRKPRTNNPPANIILEAGPTSTPESKEPRAPTSTPTFSVSPVPTRNPVWGYISCYEEYTSSPPDVCLNTTDVRRLVGFRVEIGRIQGADQGDLSWSNADNPLYWYDYCGWVLGWAQEISIFGFTFDQTERVLNFCPQSSYFNLYPPYKEYPIGTTIRWGVPAPPGPTPTSPPTTTTPTPSPSNP